MHKVSAAQASASASAPSSSLQYCTPEELHAWMTRAQPLVILDVRREEGYAQQPVQIPGALRFSLDARPPVVPSLPHDTPLLVYCT